MSMVFKLYTDSNLTQEFEWYNTDKLVFDADGTGVLYFGSTDSSMQCQKAGGGNFDITPTDANPLSGHEATEIKLATTSGGLSGATAGAALTITAPVLGGVLNKREIHYSLTDGTGGGVASTDLSLVFDTIEQLAI